MPLVRIVSSVEPPSSSDVLLRDLSGILARELGKPEAYVMTCLEPRARMTFAGTDAPACYVEVKSIGVFTPEKTARLSAVLTDRLASGLGVAKNRIYIIFEDAKPHLWGFDGDTFA